MMILIQFLTTTSYTIYTCHMSTKSSRMSNFEALVTEAVKTVLNYYCPGFNPVGIIIMKKNTVFQ